MVGYSRGRRLIVSRPREFTRPAPVKHGARPSGLDRPKAIGPLWIMPGASWNAFQVKRDGYHSRMRCIEGGLSLGRSSKLGHSSTTAKTRHPTPYLSRRHSCTQKQPWANFRQVAVNGRLDQRHHTVSCKRPTSLKAATPRTLTPPFRLPDRRFLSFLT